MLTRNKKKENKTLSASKMIFEIKFLIGASPIFVNNYLNF